MSPTIYYDCGCGCGECGETIRKAEASLAAAQSRVAALESVLRDYLAAIDATVLGKPPATELSWAEAERAAREALAPPPPHDGERSERREGDERACGSLTLLQMAARLSGDAASPGEFLRRNGDALSYLNAARGEGFREGVEAAAKAVASHHIERFNGEVIRLDAIVEAIRALAAPAAPKAPERGACDDCDGTGWLTFSDGTRAKCMACSGRGVTGGAG